MRTAKNMSCSKIIRRRRREAETRNGYIQLLARIILVIVCGGLLFTQGFLLMRAPDNGMFPAIKGGDLLIGFRLQRNFLKNDVVVYKANGKLPRVFRRSNIWARTASRPVWTSTWRSWWPMSWAWSCKCWIWTSTC